jgi:hypothetical protein
MGMLMSLVASYHGPISAGRPGAAMAARSNDHR